MVTQVQRPVTDAVAEAALVAEIRVAVPEHSLWHNVGAVNIVWRRELIRFRTDRLRAITSLIQPFLFLFVLGTGLSTLAKHGMPPGVEFKTFIYPGVLAMSVLFTSVFSAGSIVWDREFGFLREMLVARSAAPRSWSASASEAPRSRRSRALSSWPWRDWHTCRTTCCCCDPCR